MLENGWILIYLQQIAPSLLLPSQNDEAIIIDCTLIFPDIVNPDGGSRGVLPNWLNNTISVANNCDLALLGSSFDFYARKQGAACLAQVALLKCLKLNKEPIRMFFNDKAIRNLTSHRMSCYCYCSVLSYKLSFLLLRRRIFPNIPCFCNQKRECHGVAFGEFFWGDSELVLHISSRLPISSPRNSNVSQNV